MTKSVANLHFSATTLLNIQYFLLLKSHNCCINFIKQTTSRNVKQDTYERIKDGTCVSTCLSSAADAGLTDDGGFGVTDFTEVVLLTPEARLVGDYTLHNKLQSLKRLHDDLLSTDKIYHCNAGRDAF